MSGGPRAPAGAGKAGSEAFSRLPRGGRFGAGSIVFGAVAPPGGERSDLQGEFSH